MTKLTILAAIALLFFAASPNAAPQTEKITPLMLDVQDPPVPFLGSDGRIHLVYELWLKNFTSGNLTVEQVEILSGDGAVLKTLDSQEIATRLQLAGRRDASAVMPPSTLALLFVHVTLRQGQPAPARLTHRVHVRAEAAPPDQQEITETGGDAAPSAQPVALIGPPLQGHNYISADSCCDSTRHVRAALPVNGRVWLAQRFAVDWEQLDATGRIYNGPASDPNSYTIFGKPVFAVADAKVASVTDGLPEQTPGKYPENISIEQADGNSVVLDLGGGHFCLYAHLQPGKIRVRPGESVKRGQVLGLVGNSGNSVAPHLHFHVMSTASPLAANGLPYAIDAFRVTAATLGTAAFDEAESKGTPLALTPAPAPRRPIPKTFPLDQLEISFGE